MKKILAACAISTLSYSLPTLADGNSPQYLSDWWHQSINVVGSYHTRFGPQLNNDLYLEYEAFAHKDWFDFYGYVDVPKVFGAGNTPDRGIWDKGSPLFMEIEPRFSIDKLTNTQLGFGPFKEWYVANNIIYDQGQNNDSRQSTWYVGLGTISIPEPTCPCPPISMPSIRGRTTARRMKIGGMATVSKSNTSTRLPHCGAES